MFKTRVSQFENQFENQYLFLNSTLRRNWKLPKTMFYDNQITFLKFRSSSLNLFRIFKFLSQLE